jgi:hypothetical protein
MNLNQVFSLPVGAATVLDEHTRVALGTDGNVVAAGAHQRGVGHIIQPVSGVTGRNMADIVKPSAVAFVFGKITGTVTKGQRLMGAAAGAFAPLPNGVVHDLDAAASTGVAVKVAASTNGTYAIFNAVNAGSADAVFHVGAGGGYVNVDYAASPAGVTLYFDEDGVSATEGRFLCVSPTGADLLVPVSDGSYIRVFHDASAASNGVAVYFDDDGATPSQRLMWVSPTNASGSFQIDDITDVVSMAQAIESGTANDVIRMIYR